VEGLALASSTGFILVSVPTVIATRRLRGRAAVAGVGHATLAGLAAAAAGAATGLAVTLVLPTGGNVLEVGSAIIAAILAVAVFGVVAYALDRGDLRTAAGRVRRFVKGRA
jgi:putative peptidoglycan lipid II flippase